jgi:hypothetical protein
MEKDRKKQYQRPELTEHENLDKMTKSSNSEAV